MKTKAFWIISLFYVVDSQQNTAQNTLNNINEENTEEIAQVHKPLIYWCMLSSFFIISQQSERLTQGEQWLCLSQGLYFNYFCDVVVLQQSTFIFCYISIVITQQTIKLYYINCFRWINCSMLTLLLFQFIF